MEEEKKIEENLGEEENPLENQEWKWNRSLYLTAVESLSEIDRNYDLIFRSFFIFLIIKLEHCARGRVEDKCRRLFRTTVKMLVYEEEELQKELEDLEIQRETAKKNFYTLIIDGKSFYPCLGPATKIKGLEKRQQEIRHQLEEMKKLQDEYKNI